MRLRSSKLTPTEVQKFEDHIKKRHEGVFFEPMVTHNLLAGNVIELTWIIVQDRKQGTTIMLELCEFADCHAAVISLKPVSNGDYAATNFCPRLLRQKQTLRAHIKWSGPLAYLKEFNKLKAQGATDILRILPPTSARGSGAPGTGTERSYRESGMIT